jgi:protein-S-isoprenylcysteine O-methyltransferase Ste14
MSKRALLVTSGSFLVIAATLFIPAGTVRWIAGWVFLAIFGSFNLLVVRMLARNDPQLLKERMSSPIQRDQPVWDRVLLSVLQLLIVGWFILMSLDAVRFGWSEGPIWLQVFGALGIMLSLYIIYLTFRENAYLAPVVKLQRERGQSVVTSGPYRYVRHPMYSGTIIFFPATALLLGSWWGLLLSPIFVALLIVRTIFEDRMLKRGLEGYTEYSKTVKYRLIPHVW